MGLFNKKKNVVQQPKQENMNEAAYATSNAVNMYNFVQGLRTIDSNYVNNDALIERMKEDSIISSALDMWTEDALQRDPQSKDIFHIELDTPDDFVENELSKGLTKELDRFLKDDLRMEKYLPSITKMFLTYGSCPVKLDFADTLTDEKLELKESAKDHLSLVTDKLDEMFGDISSDKSIDDIEKRTLESLKENYQIDYEQQAEDVISMEHTIFKQLRESNDKYNKKLSKLNESEQAKEIKKLNEEHLLNLKKMIKGRWYTEIIGHGTNIYELTSKQKLIAYLDRDNLEKYIRPDRIVNFTNNTGKHRVTFEVGDRNIPANKKQYYYLERGESFLENSMSAWQVLAALEDILLLTRMTRSILYRIFSVEVGNKGNKETKDLLDKLKNKIKMDETVDIRSKIYNSSLSQVPLGDSIFIPTRNGVGVIDVKTVGGDINLHDAVDLDYFKDKLFAGLRIPAPFLGFTESLPGGIGDTSLTRMDIRYSRTITRIQSILSEGLKDLCLLYLKFTRTKEALEELPDFKIVFTSINSAEDVSRANLKKTQMDTLKQILDGLKGLGVDIAANSEGYEHTRQQLIKEFFGSILLDKVLKDEKTMVVQGPTEGNPKDLGNDSRFGGSDFGGGAPSDIISGPGEGLGDEELGDEELGNEETDIEDTEEVPDLGIETNDIETDTETRDLN